MYFDDASILLLGFRFRVTIIIKRAKLRKFCFYSFVEVIAELNLRNSKLVARLKTISLWQVQTLCNNRSSCR